MTGCVAPQTLMQRGVRRIDDIDADRRMEQLPQPRLLSKATTARKHSKSKPMW